MFKTLTAFLFSASYVLILNSCTKGLDNTAVVTQIELLSFENKTWNIASGPNIYLVLSDSFTNAIYYSTRAYPVRNVSMADLPVIWHGNVAIPSSGHRFCLSFYNSEGPGAELMQSIYFYIKSPADLSSKTYVSQQISAGPTAAKLNIKWTN